MTSIANNNNKHNATYVSYATYASVVAGKNSKLRSHLNTRKRRRIHVGYTQFDGKRGSIYKSATQFNEPSSLVLGHEYRTKLIPQEYWDILLDQAFKVINDSSSDDYSLTNDLMKLVIGPNGKLT